jgi:hypothetical protein
MLDKLNLEIEQRAYEEGSYIEAIKSFCEDRNVLDFEDVVEVLHPIVLQKVKAEFYEKKFFRGEKPVSKLNAFFN